MVWFQCEDCGENLKKPKLISHFRVCSACKLSCIDCGETFSRDSVQGHTQCITEAEKYGPKDQGKQLWNAQAKEDKPKPNADVDINVGLSSRPPWFCSLCKASATSKQTLLLHADGKKHRAKAKAFHAAQKPASATEPSLNEKGKPGDLLEANSSEKSKMKSSEVEVVGSNGTITPNVKEEGSTKRKRTDEASDGKVVKRKNSSKSKNGEVIQSENRNQVCDRSREGTTDVLLGCIQKPKIKLKKIISSILKPIPDKTMKIKKLQKLTIKALRDSGSSEDDEQLRTLLMAKVESSSRFSIEGNVVRLAPDNGIH